MKVRDLEVTNGCMGGCCAAFFMPRDPETISDRTVVDGDMIRDMLIPLTNEEASQRLDRIGSPMARPEAEAEGKFFTCRHFDERMRLCKVYEIRPHMCRTYPYGRDCEHGCPCKGEALPE
jgi:Fe-S-cluster containining protein